MPTITIAPEYWAQEIRNYSNWKQALWRELIQNSVDAGARNIDIQVVETPEGDVLVTCRDNGNGMTRETLEDVFFALGRTTKNTTGTIGGFGKARIVLCFAQKNYSIRTHRLLVSGQGGDYEIEDVADHLQGCTFEITIPARRYSTNVREMQDELERFLSMCHLRCSVTINGRAWSRWLLKNRYVKSFAWGHVYTNKSGSARSNYLFVRVAGVLMFKRYIHADQQVVVEVVPEISREILLANRDSLRSAAGEELDEFCNQLAADNRSALRSLPETRERFGNSVRKFIPRKRREELASQREKLVEERAREAEQEGTAPTTVRQPLAAAGVSGGQQVLSYDWSGGGVPVSSIPDYDPLVDGIILINKATDSRLRKAAYRYSPSVWKNNQGERRRKLLAQWVVACEAALESLCELRHMDELTWRAGWYFDDEARAAHEKQDDDSHALLLNPVFLPTDDFTGQMRFNLRDYESQVILVTLACHEAAHILYSWHDESFANLFTSLVEKTMPNMPNIRKQMLAA